eukprot:scaffold21642_cov73-Skeletonema_marinoi.AAC.3
MSEDTAADTSCCASCGIAEVDELKLTECTDCDLVKYCSDACRRDHKSHHLRACKKRSAELHDELLFKQPESSHFGDCPICMLPLPLEKEKSTMMTCCSKMVCNGCGHANQVREIEDARVPSCPFCRELLPTTTEGCDKQRMKRMEANDPVAMTCEGLNQYHNGDYSSAFRYYTKAAELGDAEAQYTLSIMYDDGHGVEKDRGKEMYHLEEAAIGGHPSARYNLGIEELNNGHTERAVKHFIIAAAHGHDGSTKALMKMFKEGFVDKDDLAAALRAHQAAVDATKSPQREAAKIAMANQRMFVP